MYWLFTIYTNSCYWVSSTFDHESSTVTHAKNHAQCFFKRKTENIVLLVYNCFLQKDRVYCSRKSASCLVSTCCLIVCLTALGGCAFLHQSLHSIYPDIFSCLLGCSITMDVLQGGRYNRISVNNSVSYST